MPIDLSRFGFNTVTMGGTLEHKLDCMKAAGFHGVELWARDLIAHPQGVDAAAQAVKASGLRVTDFQPLRDFECAPDAMRAHRLDMAREQLRQMTLVGADLLLVCSTTSPLAINDPDRAAGDLRTLATLAAPLGIRICYEALSWGRHVNRWHQAWDIVRRCDHAGVGLNLDSFHMAVHGDDSPETLARLAEVPAEKIFLVQLLESRGYRGDYTFEVFNDDYVNSDPMVVAQRGMQAARWLGDHAVTRAAAVSTIL